MDNELPTNAISSLNLVRDELLVTVEKSAKQLEEFFENTADETSLQGCVDGLQQISGTLELIQLRGPHQLAFMLLSVTKELTPGHQKLDDDELQSLTTAFFILPRYIEFLENTRQDHPELLLRYINDLKGILNQPQLPPSHFFSIKRISKEPFSCDWIHPRQIAENEYLPLVLRLRHMYQVALLAILQNKAQKPPLIMMAKCIERLASVYSSKPITNFWIAVFLALNSSVNSSLPLTQHKKRVLMEIEKQIKSLIKLDIAGVKTNIPIALTKELVYWVAVGANHGDKLSSVEQFLSKFGCSRLPYSDEDLSKEFDSLKGPNAQTIESVIAVFEEEISAAKSILEVSSQAQSTAEFGALYELLNKLAEILAVVGLGQPSIELKQQAKVIAAMSEDTTGLDKFALSEVADALLQVENFVIQYKNTAGYGIGNGDQTIAENQFAEAEQIVLQEAETGLTLVKRALSSYAESNFDHGHIRNVSKTLETIRGGMTLLHRERCARVLELCNHFVETELLSDEHPTVLLQLLEIFADCIISLEYYISALQSDKSTDDSILQIAEESLQSLGLSSQ